MGVTKPKKDWFHRWTYSKVSRLFSVSDATLARNRRAFPLPVDRISRLYLGIELRPYATELSEQERATQRLSMNVPVSGSLIAIPGRINDGKGHMEWMQALAVLRHTRPDLQWHAVVIGQASGADALAGGFQDRLMAQVQALGLESVITFTGFREDMPDCLKALDIVAIPSYNEAFGLSVVEAMAAGCAVVGADSGAIPEMITPERGRLAAPKDSQAWAQAFAELLDDTEQRQRIAQNAKAWSHAHFGMDQHVRLLSAFYLDAC
jgi:glycosyltransferase involved in cell wall biosynthesis